MTTGTSVQAQSEPDLCDISHYDLPCGSHISLARYFTIIKKNSGKPRAWLVGKIISQSQKFINSKQFLEHFLFVLVGYTVHEF